MTESEQDGSSRFRPGWKMTAFVSLLLPVVLILGIWQLQRAQEKRAYEEAYLDAMAGMPVAPRAELADFQRVGLEGRFEPGRDFLVDNQTHRGAVGYGVVSSFLTDDGRRWLVNRGFLAGGTRRDRLPAVVSPAGPVRVTAVVWPELGMMPIFGEDTWIEGWPKRIQRLDVGRMALALDNGVAREIRLEAGQPGVLEPPLLALNMPAEKHLGYAVQWFGLAFALGLGYLIFGFRRHD